MNILSKLGEEQGRNDLRLEAKSPSEDPGTEPKKLFKAYSTNKKKPQSLIEKIPIVRTPLNLKELSPQRINSSKHLIKTNFNPILSREDKQSLGLSQLPDPIELR